MVKVTASALTGGWSGRQCWLPVSIVPPEGGWTSRQTFTGETGRLEASWPRAVEGTQKPHEASRASTATHPIPLASPKPPTNDRKWPRQGHLGPGLGWLWLSTQAELGGQAWTLNTQPEPRAMGALFQTSHPPLGVGPGGEAWALAGVGGEAGREGPGPGFHRSPRVRGDEELGPAHLLRF